MGRRAPQHKETRKRRRLLKRQRMSRNAMGVSSPRRFRQYFPKSSPSSRSWMRSADHYRRSRPMACTPATLLAGRSCHFAPPATGRAGTFHINFGATYTFLNQYATVTPNGVRHDQLSGRPRCERQLGGLQFRVDRRFDWPARPLGHKHWHEPTVEPERPPRLGALSAMPAGRWRAGADYSEHSLLEAGFPESPALVLCGQATPQPVHQPFAVQQ